LIPNNNNDSTFSNQKDIFAYRVKISIKTNSDKTIF